MRRVIGLLLLLVAAGCEDSKFDCQDEDACALVQQAHNLDERPIRGRQSRTFEVDGRAYHLVHFEYGAGEDCPSGCSYSQYCSFVVDGSEHPAWFSFNNADEELFDPELYCPGRSDIATASDFDCDLPGLRLPVFADASFRNWVEHPDDVNDELRSCRNAFALGYDLGALPRE